jgi:two-component system copper resistance phosphate regulon response regulator CusR
MKLLIVEDDEKTAGALAGGLRSEGYEVMLAHTGEMALTSLEAEGFDLIVLDWMLPGRDGIDVLKTLRGRGTTIPVLLLTARDAVADRVFGFESGADDYLIKPFAFAELVVRIRSLLRRLPAVEPLRRRLGDLTLDLETRTVKRGEQRIDLTSREFDLLAYLLRQPGQIVTREMLAKDVWHETKRATPLDNVIDVHIAHLRRKVEEGHATTLIQTVRGVGFVLREGQRR